MEPVQNAAAASGGDTPEKEPMPSHESGDHFVTTEGANGNDDPAVTAKAAQTESDLPTADNGEGSSKEDAIFSEGIEDLPDFQSDGSVSDHEDASAPAACGPSVATMASREQAVDRQAEFRKEQLIALIRSLCDLTGRAEPAALRQWSERTLRERYDLLSRMVGAMNMFTGEQPPLEAVEGVDLPDFREEAPEGAEGPPQGAEDIREDDPEARGDYADFDADYPPEEDEERRWEQAAGAYAGGHYIPTEEDVPRDPTSASSGLQRPAAPATTERLAPLPPGVTVRGPAYGDIRPVQVHRILPTSGEVAELGAGAKAQPPAQGKGVPLVEPRETVSRAMANILRHKPTPPLLKDSGGWADLENVVAHPYLTKIDPRPTADEVLFIAQFAAEKRRFEAAWGDNGWRVRAIQGHSDPVIDPEHAYTPYEPEDPDLPEYLVHATYRWAVEPIRRDGIQPQPEGVKGRVAAHYGILPADYHPQQCPAHNEVALLRKGAEAAIIVNAMAFMAEGGVLYRGIPGVVLCPVTMPSRHIANIFDLRTGDEIRLPMPERQPPGAPPPQHTHGVGFANTELGRQFERNDPSWESYRPRYWRDEPEGVPKGPYPTGSAARRPRSRPPAGTATKRPADAQAHGPASAPRPKLAQGAPLPLAAPPAKRAATPKGAGPPPGARSYAAVAAASGSQTAKPPPPKGGARAKSQSRPAGQPAAKTAAVPKPGTPFPKPGPTGTPFQGWPEAEVTRFQQELDRRIANAHPRRTGDGPFDVETQEEANDRARREATVSLSTGRLPLETKERRKAIRWIVLELQRRNEYRVVEGQAPHIDPNDPRYNDILAAMPEGWQP